MKKINSLNLISGLLLVSALFLTSCSKEGLQEFKENKVNTGPGLQEQAATANKLTSVTTWKATDYYCASCPSFPWPSPMDVAVNFKICAGPKTANPVWASVYSKVVNSPGLTLLGSSVNPVTGEKIGCANSYVFVPGREYFVRLTCGNKWGLVPIMGLDIWTLVTIPGTSVSVFIWAS
jgi:hypothetical protein